MQSHRLIRHLATVGAFLLVLPGVLSAHRAWIVPSSTILSGVDQWITVDAAISNDLFFANHHAMRLDGISAIGPDGAEVPKHNGNEGKIRSTFDLQLTAEGTYKIQQVRDMLFASWTEDGEPRRWRGSREELKQLDPAGKEGFRAQQRTGRVETIVTAGRPTTDVFTPTGKGIELLPITHPNDLFSGETARFTLLLNGTPYAGATVTIIPGQDRYRDSVDAIEVTTDEEGVFAVEWPAPGLYWLEAEGETDAPAEEFPFPLTASASYAAILEVLPQ